MLIPGTNAPPPWMLNDHFNEVAKMQHVFLRPEPDWNFYMKEQAAGRLIYIVVRDELSANPVVGFQVVLLTQHPHYKQVKIAHDDLHYLMPFWRGFGWGGRMLDYAESCAHAAGARVFRMRARVRVEEEAHHAMYRRRGYEPFDLVYLKDLTSEMVIHVKADP